MGLKMTHRERFARLHQQGLCLDGWCLGHSSSSSSIFVRASVVLLRQVAGTGWASKRHTGGALHGCISVGIPKYVLCLPCVRRCV
jgi:hypothetical protein